MQLSRVVGLAVLFIGAGGTSAFAACYANVGCTDRDAFRKRDLRGMSCEVLNQIDSDIYTENGFCWKVRTESNKNCRYTKRAAVPLNRIERANLGTIDHVRHLKGC